MHFGLGIAGNQNHSKEVAATISNGMFQKSAVASEKASTRALQQVAIWLQG